MRSWKDRLGQSQRQTPLTALIDRPRTLPKLSRLLLALSVAAVLFCGLFPFDLDLHDFSQQVDRRFDTSFSQYFTSGDTVENILFFMPLGFSLLAVIADPLRKKFGAKLQHPLGLVGAVIAGAALSTLIELLQCSLIERDPSLTDIVNNTIGAVVGAAVYVAVGGAILARAAKQIERMQRKIGLSTMATIAAIYALAVCAVPFILGADAGKLSHWNPSFCLAVGDEIGAKRSWLGRVWDISIASRAASGAQIKSLLENAPPRQVLGDSLRAMYDVRGDEPFPDRTGTFPKLELASRAATRPSGPPTLRATIPTTQPHDVPPAPASALPWNINPETWLRTAAPMTALSNAIASSGQFTVAFTVSSDKPAQFEASRILTLSRGSESRNLTFAQDGEDLIVRVACGATSQNGDSPEFVVSDVFTDSRPRRIVATFADTQLRVFINSMAWTESARITPEAAIMWSLYPRSGWKFAMRAGDGGVIDMMYRAMVFLPLGALAAATVNLARRSYRERIPIAFGIVLATAMLLEGSLGAIGGYRMSAVNFIACLICGWIGVAVVGIRRSLPWKA